MSRSGVPRWAALAVLPLVVGAVLLMHGLDASAGTPAPASAPVEQHHRTGTDHHGACDSCPGPHHLVIVCVAVVATIGTCRATRHLSTRMRATVSAVAPLAKGARTRLTHAAPLPGPVWVRLSVMRC